MTAALLKTSIAMIMLFSLAQAQQTSSQVYSELQGTHWAGEFQANIKTKKNKLLFATKSFPIEISFLKQQDEKGIGYTFEKDIANANRIEKRGFKVIDSVPCYNPDKSQEPRHISVVAKPDGSYSGKIKFNDCKPGKKGVAQKVAKELPIIDLRVTKLANKEQLSILVIAEKGIVVEIRYTLTRVKESELKLKKP